MGQMAGSRRYEVSLLDGQDSNSRFGERDPTRDLDTPHSRLGEARQGRVRRQRPPVGSAPHGRGAASALNGLFRPAPRAEVPRYWAIADLGEIAEFGT